MSACEHTLNLRVRYSETDQMGTFYNSRVLEWFECGRTELLRAIGLPYAEMERQGVLLPVIEAHVRYLGRARYDDQLQLTTRVSMSGRVRMRFDVTVVRADGKGKVAEGYTVHAISDTDSKPIRPPDWLTRAMTTESGSSDV